MNIHQYLVLYRELDRKERGMCSFRLVCNRWKALGMCTRIPGLGNYKLRLVLDKHNFLHLEKDTDMVFDMTLLGLDSWGLDNYTLE